MEEILARLPAKSLMRFKCVSKDNNDYSHSVTLSLAPDTTNPNRFVVDHNLTSPRVGGYVLQNLCGFMCYSFINKPRIYNPATRQLVTLPAPIKSQTEEDAYDLGEIRSEHRVFVLKAGRKGSWKKASPTAPDFLPHIPAKRGMCIDGVIYYMGWTGRYNLVLVSFHIRSRDFKMIQVPRRDGDEVLLRMKNVSLIEYGGKVTIIDQTNLREKEDMFSPFHILSYDLGSNDMTKIEIKGIPDHWFSTDKSTVSVMLMDQTLEVVAQPWILALGEVDPALLARALGVKVPHRRQNQRLQNRSTL
ncbi:hypothetical protein Bca4012_098452 [Brassica carinata]